MIIEAVKGGSGCVWDMKGEIVVEAVFADEVGCPGPVVRQMELDTG